MFVVPRNGRTNPKRFEHWSVSLIGQLQSKPSPSSRSRPTKTNSLLLLLQHRFPPADTHRRRRRRWWSGCFRSCTYPLFLVFFGCSFSAVVDSICSANFVFLGYFFFTSIYDCWGLDCWIRSFLFVLVQYLAQKSDQDWKLYACLGKFRLCCAIKLGNCTPFLIFFDKFVFFGAVGTKMR